MTQLLKLGVILLILSTLLNCNNSNLAMTEEEKKVIRNEIEQLSSVLFESWNSQDFDRYLNYYLNSEEYTFAANGNVTRSWSAFSDTVRAHTVLYSRAEAKTLKRYIDILDRNVVILTQTFNWDATLKSGEA